MQKLSDLTKDILIGLYINSRSSLADIAAIYGVSRTAIYKKLKEYGIKLRSKSEARIEAQKQDKLPQKFFDINDDFFSKWAPEMAYVLGLIITDGCVSMAGTVSLCINDKELLEKVKKVMGSEHKIELSKHQKGLYYFRFSREKLVKDLEKLCVVPRKSLIVKFPDVPKEHLPDFIRGVFDGDGSVFFDKRRPKFPLRSKFVSSSEVFIVELQVALEGLGMPKRTIYKQKTKNGWSYMIIYDHKNSIDLFNLLYSNVKNCLYLERKHQCFLEGLDMSKRIL
ncbi:MAG: LAGLIDADG family homing endonuclease [Candidatus Omnitrophota bacterium]|jgi:predicted DNA-binding protein YlxM (UPF0122 family)